MVIKARVLIKLINYVISELYNRKIFLELRNYVHSKPDS